MRWEKSVEAAWACVDRAGEFGFTDCSKVVVIASLFGDENTCLLSLFFVIFFGFLQNIRGSDGGQSWRHAIG